MIRLRILHGLCSRAPLVLKDEGLLWDPGVLEPLGVRDIEREGDRPDGSKTAKVPDNNAP